MWLSETVNYLEAGPVSLKEKIGFKVARVWPGDSDSEESSSARRSLNPEGKVDLEAASRVHQRRGSRETGQQRRKPHFAALTLAEA